MTSKEFFKEVEAMSVEKGLSVDQILDSFAKGLKNGYKKINGNASCRIEFKPEKNEILMYSCKLVVASFEEEDILAALEKADDEFKNEIKEEDMDFILVSDAKEVNKRAKVGDVLTEKVDIKDVFGRSAVGQTKQVMNQSVKTYEKENSFQYFKNMENEMIIASVIDSDDSYLTLLIGQGVTTLLPRKELLASDSFGKGDRIKVYVTKVEQGTRGPKVFVSRNDKHFVIRVLEHHIPEIKDGSVEIKGIARDSGDRCKVAVWSSDPNIDPIGACVGEGGARIRNVISDLDGEKIDLYEWSDDPRTLIANSLQPTNVIAVINVDAKTRTSLAIVPDNQLSLAIGKNGQNVRLAVQSCDWKIDIKPESLAREQGYEWE